MLNNRLHGRHGCSSHRAVKLTLSNEIMRQNVHELMLLIWVVSLLVRVFGGFQEVSQLFAASDDTLQLVNGTASTLGAVLWACADFVNNRTDLRAESSQLLQPALVLLLLESVLVSFIVSQCEQGQEVLQVVRVAAQEGLKVAMSSSTELVLRHTPGLCDGLNTRQGVA